MLHVLLCCIIILLIFNGAPGLQSFHNFVQEIHNFDSCQIVEEIIDIKLALYYQRESVKEICTLQAEPNRTERQAEMDRMSALSHWVPSQVKPNLSVLKKISLIFKEISFSF